MNVLGKDNLFAAIDEAITATGQSDEYFRGMCNGMLYVKSLIDGKMPEYFRDGQQEAGETDKAYAANIRAVREKLTDAEIYAQLAEEASELAQAALKYRRCLDKTNPTPITNKEAHDCLCKGLAGVLVCVDALDGDPNYRGVKERRESKAFRWAARLNVG